MALPDTAPLLSSDYRQSEPMELITPVPSISPDFPCGKLKQYFEEHDTETVAVTLENKPVGFLSYKNIAHHFLTQFGYALFQFRPVQELMTAEFLIVDAEEDLLTIAEKALHRPPASVYDDIVVIRDGDYAGLVSIARLLLEQNLRITHQVHLLEQNKQLLETMNHDLETAMDNLRRAEAQVIQAEKMAGIGTLAAGIAHDFNNVLNVILTSSQILSMKLPQDSPLLKYCTSIEQATSRSTGLTKQLLHFSQKNSSVLHQTSLNTIVADTMKLLGRSLDKSIVPVIRCEETIPMVTVDETQIQQVILNLALNARDAMNGRGTLTVTTSTILIDKEHRTVDGKVIDYGPYVCLSIEDSGTGIPRELIKKIFDPFFTTKEVGKGSGLGLSVVYGIVSKHQGHITVESTIGVGTKFTVFLKPIASSKVPETHIHLRSKAPLNTCSGTILLVDDEQIVLNVNAELLESFGYKIIKADSGFRAVELFKERHDEIGIVLLDMMMPGMDGYQTFCALKRIHREVKVLFVSGYGEEDKFTSALEDGALGVCNKPIDGVLLSDKINEALHAREETPEATMCMN
jgi:signal transduction histidine kinase/ActR/RegA family two-component response regulator